MWDDSQLSSSNSERKKKNHLLRYLYRYHKLVTSVRVQMMCTVEAAAAALYKGDFCHIIFPFSSHCVPPSPRLLQLTTCPYSCMWRAKNMRHAQAALVSSHAPSALVTVVSHPPPRANEQLCIASLFWFFLLALVVRSHHSCLVCVGGTFFAAHVCMCTTCLRGWLCGPLFKISPPCWSTKRVEGDGDSWLLRRWGRVRTGILLADLQ